MDNNMQVSRAIDSLDDMTGIIKSELENITEGFVSVGYYLKKTRDDALYTQKGYADIYDYAKKVFGITRTTAIRFMEINDNYSIDGYSPEIQARYRGYGSSKLTEMLGLPEDVREAVPGEATVRDIRSAKAIVKETESRYEDQMELCDIAQEKDDTDWMQELAKELFQSDAKDRFADFVIWLKTGKSGNVKEDVMEMVNPTKFKMVRMKSGNVLMSEDELRVMPYRGYGEQQVYTYVDLARAFEAAFFPNYPEDLEKPAEQAYREMYGIPLREEQKSEPAKKGRDEKKAKKSNYHEAKPEEKPEGKTEEKPGQSIETNTLKDLASTQEEQVPGQMEITKDLPEYCPDNIDIMNQPEETVVESHYGSRKDFLDAAEEYKAAKYMAEAMQEFIDKKISAKSLVNEKFWKKWLNAEVDESGKEIETI